MLNNDILIRYADIRRIAMGFKSDIEIAQASKPLKIWDLAKKAYIDEKHI